MSAPITLVVLPVPGRNTHLSDTGSGTTWCGLFFEPNGAVSFAYEHGAFGEDEHDCPKCRAQQTRDGGYQ